MIRGKVPQRSALTNDDSSVFIARNAPKFQLLEIGDEFPPRDLLVLAVKAAVSKFDTTRCTCRLQKLSYYKVTVPHLTLPRHPLFCEASTPPRQDSASTASDPVKTTAWHFHARDATPRQPH